MTFFCLVGSPHVLQSDNGREFANKVAKKILTMWPRCKFVNGKLRHSQSQGSVERVNQDVESILACWLRENDTTRWTDGLRFVQWQKNNRHHSVIGRSPYKVLFREIRHNDCRGASLPNEVWKRIETEEQLPATLKINDASEENTNSDDEDASRPSDEYEIDLLSPVNDPVEIIIQNTCNVCGSQYEG